MQESEFKNQFPDKLLLTMRHCILEGKYIIILMLKRGTISHSSYIVKHILTGQNDGRSQPSRHCILMALFQSIRTVTTLLGMLLGEIQEAVQ